MKTHADYFIFLDLPIAAASMMVRDHTPAGGASAYMVYNTRQEGAYGETGDQMMLDDWTVTSTFLSKVILNTSFLLVCLSTLLV